MKIAVVPPACGILIVLSSMEVTRMTAYDLMIKTNHHLLRGGELTDVQKSRIVKEFLAARSDGRTRAQFYNGVKYPGNTDASGGRMYPDFFIPPYGDGKKYQTVIPMSPQTHILSANAYELEILRLLHLFSPNHPAVQEMVRKTLARLKTTCYGYHDCAVGECFHSSLIALRFLAAVSDDRVWMRKLAAHFRNHFGDKKRHSGVLWYYWLCLLELPMEIAGPEILRHEGDILRQLGRGYIMNSEQEKALHPVLLCVIRDLMARLPNYAHLKDCQPYVSEKDGRLRFPLDCEVPLLCESRALA